MCLYATGSYRLLEPLKVSLVLVGVAFREVSDRLVECFAARQVLGDSDWITRARAHVPRSLVPRDLRERRNPKDAGSLRAVGQEANIQQGLMDIADEVVLPATSEAFSGSALAHRDLAATYGVFPDEFGSGT